MENKNVKKQRAGKNPSQRNANEVFEDHLQLASKLSNLETDLRRNNSKDIVLLTNFGMFKGYDGMRKAAKILEKEIPDSSFEYKIKLCYKNICFLHWTSNSKQAYVDDGADSFLIENGVIKVQTIYYTVKQKN